MTYEFFKELLSYGEEFVVYYKGQKFDISQCMDLGEIYFTNSEDEHCIFNNYEELLNTPLLESKKLFEIWNELEIY